MSTSEATKTVDEKDVLRQVETEPLDFAEPEVSTYFETGVMAYPRGLKINLAGAFWSV